MMTNANDPPAPRRSNQGQNAIHALAAQFRMTLEETKLIISIVQNQNDPSLETLKLPKVQEIIKQRKGRWVQEEEDFANFLSDEFCLGLSSIANGVTKRAYLSSNLLCTKMRISKKFKGKSPGKEVFVRKEKRPDGRQFSPQELVYYEQRHLELEKRFIKAVLKSAIKSGIKNAQKKGANPLPLCPPPVPHPTTNGLQLPTATSAGTRTAIPQMNGMGAGAQTAALSHNLGQGQLINQNHIQLLAGFAAASVNTQPNSSASSQIMSTATAISYPASGGMQSPTVTLQEVKPTGYSQPSCTNNLNPIQAMKMQVPRGIEFQEENQGFGHNGMSTFQGGAEALLSYQAPAVGNDTKSNGSTNYFGTQNNYNAVPRATEGQKKRQTAELIGSIGYGFTPLLDAGGGKRFKPILTADAPHAVSTSEASSNDESSSNEASTYSHGISKRKDVTSATLYGENSIPDLLSGFDKHVASMKTTTGAFENRPIPEDSHLFAGAGIIGESPYITSKSFDELHQFVGIGLSSDKMPQLDLNQSIANHQPGCSSDHSTLGANASNQAGHSTFLGAFVPLMQASARPRTQCSASTSNSSEMTTSD